MHFMQSLLIVAPNSKLQIKIKDYTCNLVFSECFVSITVTTQVYAYMNIHFDIVVVAAFRSEKWFISFLTTS